MDKQEYLRIVAILENTRRTIDLVRNTLTVDTYQQSKFPG